jgi:hypothetical protein
MLGGIPPSGELGKSRNKQFSTTPNQVVMPETTCRFPRYTGQENMPGPKEAEPPIDGRELCITFSEATKVESKV